MFRPCVALLMILFSGMLLLGNITLSGQPRPYRSSLRVPIYKSAQDSVRLAKVDSQIATLRNTTPVNVKKLDSLLSLYHETHEQVITGYRNIYRPAQDHVSLDSLLKMKEFDSVTKVSIYRYDLPEIPSVIFQCKNLESLEMISCAITELPETLASLSKLRTIRIYNPVIKGKIKLRKNQTVSLLIIRSDNPRCLPRSFRAFSALETLDLSGNSLKRFPNGARRNKRLRELNLRNNELTLKRRLRRHPYVETLALQHNKIRRVPKSISAFRSLKKLNFNYNEITVVHPAIRLLSKVENLSFYHNELRAIPDGVYEMTGLREVDLFYNKIETVEPRILQWKNIKRLYLSHNKLISLPRDIGALTSLEGLYVWDNLLETLPESVGELKGLRYLWLNNNSLQRLPASLFSLGEIEELDVSHNYLTSISESVFDFKHLKILSLIDNPWDKPTLSFIHRRVDEARARNVFVHVPDR